jgi:hypothetical protein
MRDLPYAVVVGWRLGLTGWQVGGCGKLDAKRLAARLSTRKPTRARTQPGCRMPGRCRWRVARGWAKAVMAADEADPGW